MMKKRYSKPEMVVVGVKPASHFLTMSVQLRSSCVEESDGKFEDGWQY